MKFISVAQHFRKILPEMKDSYIKQPIDINYTLIKNIWSSAACEIDSTPYKTLEWYYDEELRNPKYNNIEITYTLNKQGFRVYKESGGKKIIACFGCSNTFGVGLRDEETWPYLMWDYLGRAHYSVVNFGLPGSSTDMICRLICSFLKNNKPKAIVCFFPEITRREVYSEFSNSVTNFFPTYKNNQISEKEYEDFCKTTNFNDSLLNFVKNFKFIETLCKLNNVKLIWHTWSPALLSIPPSYLREVLDTNTSMLKKDENDIFLNINESNRHGLNVFDRARDGFHNGLTYNKILASNFAKNILKEIMS